MGLKLAFTQDPYETARFADPNGGTVVGITFKFRNSGDAWGQQGTYTNSWFAINNNTAEEKTRNYYPPTDMQVGAEYEDYIQLEQLGSGTWQVFVALDTSGQVAIAGAGGADDGRTFQFTI